MVAVKFWNSKDKARILYTQIEEPNPEVAT